MISIVKGDIADANADIIVNASNGCGYMGGKRCKLKLHRGIAESLNYHTHGDMEKESLQAARRFTKLPSWLFGTPPGRYFITGPHGLHCKKVFHAVTMRYPGSSAKLQHIDTLLNYLYRFMRMNGYWSVALPLLGAGTGGLDRVDVINVITKHFDNRVGLSVLLYSGFPNKAECGQSNVFIGEPGSGIGFHPWDGLKPCPKCGHGAWMVGKDGKNFNSGSPYQVICTSNECNYKSISSDNIQICRDDWNNSKNSNSPVGNL